MAAPAIGTVVLISFPFSDLSSAKLRPAIVLAEAGRGDYILCQITSNPYADPEAIEIQDVHFGRGGLQRESYARPGKLFTASESLVVREVGTLVLEKRLEVVEAIDRLLWKDLS